MMNPAALFKIKGMWERFTQNHPKFPMFLQAVGNNAITEGSIIEVKVVKTDGESITTNIRVTADDMELFHELSQMSK